jgi:hypothetical protein
LGENLEFGFFTKIYGGRFSPQTSTDQVLYAVTALDAFYNFATAGERQEIRTMLPAMVNFWIKRGYKYTYYLEKDMLWPLDRFPALMLLAMQYSAEPVFKSEYERLLPLTVEASCSRLKKKLSGETPPGKYEIQQHAWVLNQVADAFTMQTMQNLLLLRFDPENPLSETWKADIARLWKEAKLTIAPDGKNYFRVLVDMDSGEARQMPADSPFPGGGSRMGWTPMIVRAALEGIDYLPDRENVLTLCLKVLNQLDVMDLTYFDDPACFPEEMRYKTRFLSGDAMTNYLWSCELIKRMEGGM